VDRTDDAEQDPAGDTAPRAILQPCVAFAGLIAFDLTGAQRACRDPSALGCAPPARSEQGKAPEDGFVFVEQNELATACPILQGGECERAVREVCGMRIEPPGGAVVA
jgi:hypothetical protein